MLTSAEQNVLRTYRQYLVSPGQMLCFYGPKLQKYRSALQQLTDKEMLIKEQFKGAYSLTKAGFVAMKSCS